MSDRFRGRAVFRCESGVRIRFADFAIDGNRQALEVRGGLPSSDVPFEKFTLSNGILVADNVGLTISGIRFVNMVGFAVLVSRSRDVAITSVEVSDSGSRNQQGHNNTTGGILLEEGTTNFRVLDSDLRNIRGNGIWTHSLYTSPRNADGRIAGNRFSNIGRDAIQVGHATNVHVEGNSGSYIGYPVADVDIEGHGTPVAIDTAGNTDKSAYVGNRFEEINGQCIDLDGFHHGDVRDNHCINRRAAASYPYGHYGIVMGNSNPDMIPEQITIVENELVGTLYGAVFVIGSGHTISRNRFRLLNLAHCAEGSTQFGCNYASVPPGLLRSGIYLGSGAERPAPARDNTIANNDIQGFGMREHCIAAAPDVSLDQN
jgi:hypothetical protein